jgi:hypothetical protein
MARGGWAGFTKADDRKARAVDPALDDVLLHPSGPAFTERHVVGVGSALVGVPCDLDQLRVLSETGEVVHDVLHLIGAYSILVEVEKHRLELAIAADRGRGTVTHVAAVSLGAIPIRTAIATHVAFTKRTFRLAIRIGLTASNAAMIGTDVPGATDLPVAALICAAGTFGARGTAFTVIVVAAAHAMSIDAIW